MYITDEALHNKTN